jgi:hypothetical protein
LRAAEEGECVRSPPWPLLVPDADDGEVGAEKCRLDLVHGRVVVYANGGEDDTAKSYDVGEAVG